MLLSIASISEVETPPDVPGLDTVTATRPEELTSETASAAVTCVALTNVVVFAVPFNNTVAPVLNPVPFTVRTIPVEPATTTAGVTLPRMGAPETGAATVIVTAAALLVVVTALASATVKLRLSLPAYPAVGVYIRLGIVPVKTPCDGLAVTA